MENPQPKLVRFFAHVISYVFHPLFIPTYFLLYLLQVIPYEFVGITDWKLNLKIFSVFWWTAFLPAFAVFLMWRLKLSTSIFLKTQRERIIPYVIVMFFYWWMYYLSRNFTDQPIALKFFFFGVFISSSIGLIVNNYMKVSLHAMAISALLMAVLLTNIYYPIGDIFWVLLTILLTGFVISARMVVSDHTKNELIVGFIIGIVTQLMAYFWVL
ncbi:MAG: hypothetical protein RL064_870 [Bacteroidota bacterium]|jgi:hypothetical protein